MKELLLAIQFLTVIPINIKGTVTEAEVGRSAIFFPAVGALQGLVASLAVILLIPVFPDEIVAGLTITLLVILTGGFHLDGLADTFDGTAVKSTGDAVEDRKKRLTVMKDSSTGAIGVAAIALVILLKYVFIGSVLREYAPWSAAYVLFLMPLFSKWSLIPAMCHGNPAAGTGLGKIFIDQVRGPRFLVSSLVLVVIYFASAFIAGGNVWLEALLFLFVAGLPLYALSLLWTFGCRRKFGGLTGDTLGALGEVAEVLFLAIAFLWF